MGDVFNRDTGDVSICWKYCSVLNFLMLSCASFKAASCLYFVTKYDTNIITNIPIVPRDTQAAIIASLYATPRLTSDDVLPVSDIS